VIINICEREWKRRRVVKNIDNDWKIKSNVWVLMIQREWGRNLIIFEWKLERKEAKLIIIKKGQKGWEGQEKEDK